MKHAGETRPEPFAIKHYSGQFGVRIPPQVHHALALEAAEQGVRLNRLTSAKLAAQARWDHRRGSLLLILLSGKRLVDRT
jgi:hypothetical protein